MNNFSTRFITKLTEAPLVVGGGDCIETAIRPKSPSPQLQDPVMDPILEAIREADVHQLIYIEQVKIPNTKGITDEERDELKRAARERFVELNTMRRDTTPTKDFSTGRWTGSLHTSEAGNPKK
jgi:hypothetical protein